MAWKGTYDLAFHRRRQEKTNYAKRLALVKSDKPRLVVRRSANTITAQLVEYNEKGDKVLIGVSSTALAKMGWNHHTGNLSAAYLTGLMVGVKGKRKGIHEAILDIGLTTPVWGSAIFAALKGAVDAGLSIPHDPKILPKDDRVDGTHIQKHGQAKNSGKITESFAAMKGKIMALKE